MNRINYQKELDHILEKIARQERRPSLLLHSCCAPCSSYCLEYLSQYFDITVFYYNPNITDEQEYAHRVGEQLRLTEKFASVSFREGPYDRETFFKISRGLEDVSEGGARCARCFALRLSRTAREAAAGGYDYFTTTLSISPLKDAQKLNEIGARMAKAFGSQWLPADFKKKGGYKRSVELSAQYDLYRQDYCGCVYSKAEMEKRKAAKRSEGEISVKSKNKE